VTLRNRSAEFIPRAAQLGDAPDKFRTRNRLLTGHRPLRAPACSAIVGFMPLPFIPLTFQFMERKDRKSLRRVNDLRLSVSLSAMKWGEGRGHGAQGTGGEACLMFGVQRSTFDVPLCVGKHPQKVIYLFLAFSGMPIANLYMGCILPYLPICWKP
jgi:hypothetical protein